MKKISLPLVLVSAFLTMGIAMPSCPGQQAMQQQVDELTKINGALTQKVQGLENQLKTVTAEHAEMKSLLTQATEALTTMKAADDQLAARVQALETRPAAKAAPKAAAPKAPARRR